jgi:hypothetical protein
MGRFASIELGARSDAPLLMALEMNQDAHIQLRRCRAGVCYRSPSVVRQAIGPLRGHPVKDAIFSH